MFEHKVDPAGPVPTLILVQFDIMQDNSLEFMTALLNQCTELDFVDHAHYYDDAVWIYPKGEPFSQEQIDEVARTAKDVASAL